jgi:CBS domain-containing protein
VLIGEVMTGSVVTASPETSVREVAELMRERNVGSIVLVDRSGLPVGLLTDRDIVVGAVADGRDPDGDHAGDHASGPVVCGRPEMDLEQAAELMVRHKIRRLPVLDGDRLTGIVTLDDLVARTGDTEVAHTITSAVTRAALPEFYFFNRGG